MNKQNLLSYHTKAQVEAGTDEAGRGCLAGPVVAAAVILKPGFKHALIRDSKKLKQVEREELFDIIKENSISYGIKAISPERIDEINILNASIEAMHYSLAMLKKKPEFILVDGNRFKPFEDIPFECVIKGDDKYLSIAAASILAKVERDRIMSSYAEKYPQYAWQKNKGYPTAEHRDAIRRHGPTPIHRRSFRLLPDAEQLELFV